MQITIDILLTIVVGVVVRVTNGLDSRVQQGVQVALDKIVLHVTKFRFTHFQSYTRSPVSQNNSIR